MSTIMMREVKSSDVYALAYDDASRTLHVQYRDHEGKPKAHKYVYSDVPVSVFNELVNARSVGGYMHHFHHFKNYPVEKVELT